jgi:hypothetical protein
MRGRPYDYGSHDGRDEQDVILSILCELIADLLMRSACYEVR